MKHLLPILTAILGILAGTAFGPAFSSDSEQTASPPLLETAQATPTETPAPATTPSDPAIHAKLHRLTEQVRRLELDKLTLTRQVAETNRDLAELQFQVDSHSESFRPLRASDLMSNGETVAPTLLPPRNR